MRPEHRDEVIRFWGEHVAPAAASDSVAARYCWTHTLNPAGPPATVLALAQEGAEVVGCGSAYPRTVHVAGEDLRAGMLADLAVARAHRTAGAALGIQRALVTDRESAYAFLFGFPNKSALPILKRVGCRPLAALHDWIKPLTALYKTRAIVGVEWAARATAAPVDWYLRAGDAWRRSDKSEIHSEIIDRADDRFDQLWRRARSRFVVAGERTAKYLNWRYTRAGGYQFFCLSRASDLIGYVAFLTRSDKVFIVDLFALDMEETAEQLLLHFARSMRRAGLQSVCVGYAGNQAFASRLKRTGFIPRPGAERTVVLLAKGTTERQGALLFDPENWYLFSGEIDL